MKAFVTGATGFIGGRLVRRLIERGDQVFALVRSNKDAEALQSLGATPVIGDIRERESMRAGMQGSDVVFHVAAWYKIGAKDWKTAEEINVQGTRNVLGLAHELGVPRIVYTSTVAVFGDTQGKVVDESYYYPGPMITEYDRTKWKAHYEAAVPLIEQGAPVIIVQPGGVYGPGDRSLIAQMMEWFYRGRFPLFPAPQSAITFAHVEDIVSGHLLAAEKGRPGESYILTGPSYSMRDMVQLWSELTGRPAPLLYLPPGMVKPFGPLMGWLSQYIELPELFSQESIAITDATYLASSEKARRELGWQTRPVVDGMRETLADLGQHSPAPAPDVIRKRQNAGLVMAVAAGLMTLWLLSRPRK